jgi:hypothetical protein
MASFVTNRGARDLTVGTTGVSTIDWNTDVIKARLVKSTATVNKDDTTMTPYTIITGSTDQTLTSPTFTEDTTNDRIVYDAADPTWTAVTAGETISHVAIFKFVTNDAGSTPICVIDVTDTATNGGDITLTFDSTGVFYLQQ